MRKRLRYRLAGAAAVVVLAAGIAAIPLPSDPPVYAAPIGPEVQRTDVLLETNNLISGYDLDQGYHRLGAADYNDGGAPDCAMATPQAPNTEADADVAMGLAIREGSGGVQRNENRYSIYAKDDDLTNISVTIPTGCIARRTRPATMTTSASMSPFRQTQAPISA